MAPFRASRNTRSGRPGNQTEHDIFEGLPVRQWRLHEVPVGQTGESVNEKNGTSLGVDGRPEPPLPKGATSYTPNCLQLLRYARAGRLRKIDETGSSANGVNGHAHLNGVKEDETNGLKEASDQGNGDGPRGTKRPAPQGLVTTRWTQIPKHMEQPEREYLAKKRIGIPATLAAVNGATGPMRKIKVRRLDAKGDPVVWEVMIAEGQTVAGEIREPAALESVAGEVSQPAPGTVVEGLGVANEDGVVVASESAVQPIRKKPPVPKKKGKKFMKGQKLSFTDGAGVSASAEELEAKRKREAMAQSGIKEESRDDTPMGGTQDGEDEDAEEEDEAGSEEAEVREPGQEENKTTASSAINTAPVTSIALTEGTASARQESAIEETKTVDAQKQQQQTSDTGEGVTKDSDSVIKSPTKEDSPGKLKEEALESALDTESYEPLEPQFPSSEPLQADQIATMAKANKPSPQSTTPTLPIESKAEAPTPPPEVTGTEMSAALDAKGAVTIDNATAAITSVNAVETNQVSSTVAAASQQEISEDTSRKAESNKSTSSYSPKRPEPEPFSSPSDAGKEDDQNTVGPSAFLEENAVSEIYTQQNGETGKGGGSGAMSIPGLGEARPSSSNSSLNTNSLSKIPGLSEPAPGVASVSLPTDEPKNKKHDEGVAENLEKEGKMDLDDDDDAYSPTDDVNFLDSGNKD